MANSHLYSSLWGPDTLSSFCSLCRQCIDRHTCRQNYPYTLSKDPKKFFNYICMCSGAPVCGHTFRCLCGWGELVSVRCSASGVVHQAFWRQHVSETWGSAVQLSWLARELQAPLCHCFPGIDNASAFKKMLAWGSNLGPHACVVSTLNYLPSPGSILLCSCMPSKRSACCH